MESKSFRSREFLNLDISQRAAFIIHLRQQLFGTREYLRGKKGYLRSLFKSIELSFQRRKNLFVGLFSKEI